MIWISLILEIIQEIPTIIKLIEEIVALIHGHPLQVAHEHAFLGLLAAWRDHRDPAKLTADIKSLKAKVAAG